MQLCEWHEDKLFVVVKNREFVPEIAHDARVDLQVISKNDVIVSAPCLFSDFFGGLWCGVIDCEAIASQFDDYSVQTLKIGLSFRWDYECFSIPSLGRFGQHVQAFRGFTSGFYQDEHILLIPDESKSGEYVIRAIGDKADASAQPYAMSKRDRPYQNLVLLASLALGAGYAHSIGKLFQDMRYKPALSLDENGSSIIVFDVISPIVQFDVSNANDLIEEAVRNGDGSPGRYVDKSEEGRLSSAGDGDWQEPSRWPSASDLQLLSGIRSALFLSGAKESFCQLDVSARARGFYREIDSVYSPFFEEQLQGKMLAWRVPLLIDEEHLAIAIEDMLCFRGDAQSALDILSIRFGNLDCPSEQMSSQALVEAGNAVRFTVEMYAAYEDGRFDDADRLAQSVLEIFPYAIEAFCVHAIVCFAILPDKAIHGAVQQKLERMAGHTNCILPFATKLIIQLGQRGSGAEMALFRFVERDFSAVVASSGFEMIWEQFIARD